MSTRKFRVHDCMDLGTPFEGCAGDTTPRTGEVELSLEQKSRATQEAKAENRSVYVIHEESWPRRSRFGSSSAEPTPLP